MKHGFADTKHGQIHYVEHGSGSTVLLLHQTPRSCDEYREVLPILGERYRAIAIDTLGFGLSDRPSQEWSIELFADGAIGLCDSLGIDKFAIVGHHTGAVVAVEIAAKTPNRIAALVLSGMPYVDAERRELVAARPPIDRFETTADGVHLLQMWNNRKSFYPDNRPDLLNRLVRDALAVGERVEEGHEAVNRYHMEDRIGHVAAPTLVVCGEFDDFSRPDMPKIVAAIPGASSAILPGTGVPAVDHLPEQFASVVDGFLVGQLPKSVA